MTLDMRITALHTPLMHKEKSRGSVTYLGSQIGGVVFNGSTGGFTSTQYRFESGRLQPKSNIRNLEQ